MEARFGTEQEKKRVASFKIWTGQRASTMPHHVQCDDLLLEHGTVGLQSPTHDGSIRIAGGHSLDRW